jgi:NAD+ kinase
LRSVALVINTAKPLAVQTGKEIIAWLEERSIRPVLHEDSAATAGRPDLIPANPAGWGDAELVIVLGGDGTLMRTVREVAPLGLPVLGVNTGHLGFLTSVENVEMGDHLATLIEGPVQIEQRLMICAEVKRDQVVIHRLTALNDAVVSKGARSKVVKVQVGVGDTSVATFTADGVIVATPTGSTAYSLSCGGPIMAPTVEAMLITPISPHTMMSRPIVVGAHETVIITVIESRGEIGLSADGMDPFPLQEGDQVVITRSPHVAKLVRRLDYRFYDVLREKLAPPVR